MKDHSSIYLFLNAIDQPVVTVCSSKQGTYVVPFVIPGYLENPHKHWQLSQLTQRQADIYTHTISSPLWRVLVPVPKLEHYRPSHWGLYTGIYKIFQALICIETASLNAPATCNTVTCLKRISTDCLYRIGAICMNRSTQWCRYDGHVTSLADSDLDNQNFLFPLSKFFKNIS